MSDSVKVFERRQLRGCTKYLDLSELKVNNEQQKFVRKNLETLMNEGQSTQQALHLLCERYKLKWGDVCRWVGVNDVVNVLEDRECGDDGTPGLDAIGREKVLCLKGSFKPRTTDVIRSILIAELGATKLRRQSNQQRGRPLFKKTVVRAVRKY
jgi:hypothetical protein